MSVIVRERYPISALPDDLRAGLPEHGWVRVSIEAEEPESTDALGRRLDLELAEGAADLDAGRVNSIDDVRQRLRSARPITDAAE